MQLRGQAGYLTCTEVLRHLRRLLLSRLGFWGWCLNARCGEITPNIPFLLVALADLLDHPVEEVVVTFLFQEMASLCSSPHSPEEHRHLLSPNQRIQSCRCFSIQSTAALGLIISATGVAVRKPRPLCLAMLCSGWPCLGCIIYPEVGM